MKNKEQIESMIADIETYYYESQTNPSSHTLGYLAGLKWVIKEE